MPLGWPSPQDLVHRERRPILKMLSGRGAAPGTPCFPQRPAPSCQVCMRLHTPVLLTRAEGTLFLGYKRAAGPVTYGVETMSGHSGKRWGRELVLDLEAGRGMEALKKGWRVLGFERWR